LQDELRFGFKRPNWSEVLLAHGNERFELSAGEVQNTIGQM